MPIDRTRCCGCGLCAQLCAKKAIRMEKNQRGFIVAIINTALCNHCGKCEKTCPMTWHAAEKDNREVFAWKHGDDAIRKRSSSGGAFYAIAQSILSTGNGVVYGAAYDDAFALQHMRAETEHEADRFFGSKYAQSTIDKTYDQVRIDLASGKSVLFSGTPCQTAAMRTYLTRINATGIENLYLMDFVCSGTPPGKMLQEFVGVAEKKEKSRVVGYQARCKEYGWKGAPSKMVFANGKSKIGTPLVQAYQNIFRLKIAYNEMCYHCPYVSESRVSDMTVGDFWGIDECAPEFNDNRGVSLVMLNTERGKKLFKQEVIRRGVAVQLTTTDAMTRNHWKQHQVNRQIRDTFWQKYEDGGIERILCTYGQFDALSRLKYWVKKYLHVGSNKLLASIYKKLRMLISRMID